MGAGCSDATDGSTVDHAKPKALNFDPDTPLPKALNFSSLGQPPFPIKKLPASARPRHAIKWASDATAPPDAIVFALNTQRLVIPAADVNPAEMLFDFLRSHTSLSGTKRSCGQGGCGACTVELTRANGKPCSSLACLQPIAALHGCQVTTVEGLQEHPVQRRVVDFNGSQCGYCTPGMVMSLYSALREKRATSSPADPARPLGTSDLPQLLDGNLCRCTGYFPLANACRSFCADIDPKSLEPHSFKAAGAPAIAPYLPDEHDVKVPAFLKSLPRQDSVTYRSGNITWHRCTTLASALSRVKEGAELVVGSTATAWGRVHWRHDGKTHVFAEVSAVPELNSVEVQDIGLKIGGAVTISDFLNALEQCKARASTFEALAMHVAKVGSRHVRNMGSVAGNLAVASATADFGSDLATLLVLHGAAVTLVTAAGNRTEPVEKYLARPHEAKDLITAVFVPFDGGLKAAAAKGRHCRSLKVTVRGMNSGAIVNAGLLICEGGDGSVEADGCRFVLGGLPPQEGAGQMNELVCKKLGAAMVGAKLGQLAESHQAALVADLQSAYPVFPEQTMTLAKALFKRLWLSVTPGSPSPWLPRNFPKGEPTSSPVADPKEAPLHLAITKTTAPNQAAGTIKYAADQAVGSAHKLIAKWLTSPITKGAATLSGEALQKLQCMDGVVAYIDATDVVGENRVDCMSSPVAEPLFARCSAAAASRKYAVEQEGQTLGMVCAESEIAAMRGVEFLRDSLQLRAEKPIVGWEDAVRAKSFWSMSEVPMLEQDSTTVEHGDALKILRTEQSDTVYFRGRVNCSKQMHFPLERQTAYAVPEAAEDGGTDGVSVWSSMQWPGGVQAAVASVLGIRKNKVCVKQHHAGGAFGGKVSRNAPVAAAVSLGAVLLGRPVLLELDLAQEFRLVGGRPPTSCEYEVRANKNGEILALRADVFIEQGSLGTDYIGFEANALVHGIDSVYAVKDYSIRTQICKTNDCIHTVLRCPGHAQGCIIAETIMDHAASAVGLRPMAVREKNFERYWDFRSNDGDAFFSVKTSEASNHFHTMWTQLKEECHFEERRVAVDTWNASVQATGCVYRGLALVPAKLKVGLPQAAATVKIFWGGGTKRLDGSVAVHVNGCEIGQGLYTKVQQTASFCLSKSGCKGGVPMELIRVLPTDSIQEANGMGTVNSTTSELACLAVQGACEELVERVTSVWVKAMTLAGALKTGGRGRDEVSHYTWPELISSLAIDPIHGGIPAVDLTARKFVMLGAVSSRDLGFFTKDLPKLVSLSDGYIGHPMYYDLYGTCAVEVEVDALTGQTALRRVDLIYDAARSLNPAVDIGQIQGAFMMGVGQILRERVERNSQDHGELAGCIKSRHDTTWQYKPPCLEDCPEIFNTKFFKEADFPRGIFGSKATGEGPLLMSVGVLAAVRDAVMAARKNAGLTEWVQLDVPLLPQKIVEVCGSFASLQRAWETQPFPV